MSKFKSDAITVLHIKLLSNWFNFEKTTDKEVYRKFHFSAFLELSQKPKEVNRTHYTYNKIV